MYNWHLKHNNFEQYIWNCFTSIWMLIKAFFPALVVSKLKHNPLLGVCGCRKSSLHVGFYSHVFCAILLMASVPQSSWLLDLLLCFLHAYKNLILFFSWMSSYWFFFNKTQNYCCVLKDPTWSNSTFIFKVTLSLEYRRGEMSTSSQHFREQMRSMKLSTGE